jgi:hypothetical protein
MDHPRLHHGKPLADLAGQLTIARERGCLVLPEIEIAARQRLKSRRLRHGETIAKGAG